MAFVHVLDEDPELGRGLDPAGLALARRVATARVATSEVGEWRWDAVIEPEPGDLGLLALDGFVVRHIGIAGREWAEPLGRGDLLRPWDVTADERAELVRPELRFKVLAPLRVAVLDRAFAEAAGRWPALVEALISRTLRRSRWQARLLAINSRPRLDERVLVLFRHLADVSGRVTRDGIVVDVPLTHELLAQIVGAQRPSVTKALALLAEQGALRRTQRGSWLLSGPGRAIPPPGPATPPPARGGESARR